MPSAVQDLARAFRAASGLHRAGRIDEAKAAYQDIRRRAPRQTTALHFLGVIAQQQGDHELAIELMTKAIEEKDRFHYFHGNLGEVYRALGRFDEAIACCRRALDILAVYPDGLNTLGASLLAKGEYEEAETILRRAIEFKPDLAVAHANLGNLLKTRGKYDEAVAALEEALRLVPGFAGAHAAMGEVRHAQGEPERAVECYRRALELNPNDVTMLSDLAISFRKLDRVDEAIDYLRQAVRLRPNFTAGHVNLGTMLLFARHQPDEAIACFQEALRIAPDFVEAHQGMAQVLTVRGNFDKAATYLRRALEIKADFMPAYVSLTHSGMRAGDDDEISRLESLLEQGQFSIDDECGLRFALGMAHDRAGRFDEAFRHFQAGNEHKGVSGSFDFNGFAASIDGRIAAYGKALLDERQSWGSASDRPVFIVGMPRSGTTLVEQIAASHPQFFGAGELEELGTIEQELSTALKSATPAAARAPLIDEATARRLAERYLAALDSLAPAAPRVSDKMPGNFLRLGLIALLFPRARVIHCRRNPLDVCLSCYFQNFRELHAYAYDLAELGAYYRHYERLMAHWRDALPVAMLEVDYEDLVADQEGESRRIIEFCGLEWDDACLNFHESDRAVFTASNWQVRQPIYATSVERWRNYDAHLGPLKSALGITDMKDGPSAAPVRGGTAVAPAEANDP